MTGRPRRFKNGVQISVRLESDLLERLQARAAELEIDRSQLINKLLKRHLSENPFAPDERPAPFQAAAEDPAAYQKPNADEDRAS